MFWFFGLFALHSLAILDRISFNASSVYSIVAKLYSSNKGSRESTDIYPGVLNHRAHTAPRVAAINRRKKFHVLFALWFSGIFSVNQVRFGDL